MKSDQPHDENVAAITARLEKTRKALKMKPGAFADAAGIGRSTYSNWKKGKGRPELTQALKLCKAHGLTLDWIYRGILEGVSKRVWDAITSYKDDQATPSKTMERRPFANRS